MGIRTLPFVWIIVGLGFIYYGLDSYWNYSRPGILWLFIIPEIYALKQILIGVISLIIGKKLFNKERPIQLLINLSYWLVILEIGVSVVNWGYTLLFILFDLLVYAIIIHTLYGFYKTGVIKSTKDLKMKFRNNLQRIMLRGSLLFVLVLLVSKILSYRCFEFIH